MTSSKLTDRLLIMAEVSKKEIKRIPLVPIRGTVVFPHTDALLTFGRPKSLTAVNLAFQKDRIVAIFTQKDPRTVDPGKTDLYPVGTVATITQMMSTEGEVHALIHGQARIRIEKVTQADGYMMAEVTEIPEPKYKKDELKALANQLTELFKKAINLGKQAEVMTVMRLSSGEIDANELADQVSAVLDLKIEERQDLLESLNLKDRLKKVLEYLIREVKVLEIERSISTKTQKRFEDRMRRAMLQEKKRTIMEELGENDEDEDPSIGEVGEYKRKIKLAEMPKEVKKKANKELKRLAQLSPQNPEGGYIRNYLDWLCEVPWSKLSKNDVSVKKAGKILDDNHYGIKKAKERILEYLSVVKIKKELEKGKVSAKHSEKASTHPTILCFIGPPGVGKTSIGRSIAKALGRKFVRISLGGIRDEAEIRGHRRTYVGALPGRIVQGIKNAGTRNPVFMLDEIDKIGSDFRGDPSSALLEALDPEQNREFSDHYLEVPLDLSDVFFIATGNVLDTIPHALLDRMEIIRFSGYTQEEKFNIAKTFIWDKQVEQHGLKGKKITLSGKALNELIEKYTHEAGVRGLERNIATVLRKIARLVAEKKSYPKNITVEDVQKFLGPERYSSLIAEKKDEVGMATGLGVTPAGGEIMFVEVALMPGNGKLTLTGQLGSVMKESARAAFTWTKSHWKELGLKENFSSGIDVHIHVPAGAMPKDGPSAGTSMTTALVSALTGTPVRRNVGMTGEITLRGRVTEIGGVKEKVIAGYRAGLKTIIMPADNKKDLEDLPEIVTKNMTFVFATRINDVLTVAMKNWPPINTKFEKEPIYPRPAFLTAVD